jgi:hypothetical protein
VVDLLWRIQRGSSAGTDSPAKQSQSYCPNARHFHPVNFLPTLDLVPRVRPLERRTYYLSAMQQALFCAADTKLWRPLLLG